MRLKIGRRKITIHREGVIGFLLGVLLVGGVYELTTYMTSQTQPVTTLRYDSKGVTIAWLPSTVSRWSSDIERAAKEYDVNANAVAIFMAIESAGYSKADSGVARGLMQVTDYTAGDIAQKFLKEPRSEYDLYDPATSIEFGAAYLSYLRKTFCVDEQVSSNECMELLAAGYNGGPGAANSLYEGDGLEDMETVGYSRDARNMWRERDAARSPTYTRWLERGGQSLVNAAQNE